MTNTSDWFLYYTIAWSTTLVGAVLYMAIHRRSFAILQDRYLRYMLEPWKVVTFVVAMSGLVAVGPFTGDPTWDFATASFMSFLTYATAPWAVGAIYRVLRGQAPFRVLIPAVLVWLFSASWSYDLYLWVRDGYYPVTWLANLFASSLLYLSAGLFWNLQYTAVHGVRLAFTESDWPRKPDEPQFRKVLPFALPFMILVSLMILYFLIPGERFYR